jgi:hypothetical protein
MLSSEAAYMTCTGPPVLAVGVAEGEEEALEDPHALISRENKDAIDTKAMVRESRLCGKICVGFTGCSFAKYSLYEYSTLRGRFSISAVLVTTDLVESQRGGLLYLHPLGFQG